MQQKQEKNVKHLNQNSTQKIQSQDEVQSLTEIIHLLENEAQVKISGLEQEILVLKEENVKLRVEQLLSKPPLAHLDTFLPYHLGIQLKQMTSLNC